MAERFTEGTQNLMALAHEDALHFNHNYIGTEHLLLGLLRGGAEDPAARVLREFGFTLEGGRTRVESIVGYGDVGRRRVAQPPPFTPRSSKVMIAAWREARELGEDSIGTEHILLGLLREGAGVASRMLADLRVDREAVIRELRGSTAGNSRPPDAPWSGPSP